MRHNHKTGVLVGLGAIAVFLATGAASCGGGSSSGATKEAQDSAGIENSYLINQPPPHFQHSDIRAAAINVEAIQALGEQTTSFGFQQGDPNPIWSCPSLGEPVASTTQITNPDQTQSVTVPHQGGAAVTIGNMDPNGIYSGESTGTYVVCVNGQGQQYSQYWEGNVDSVSGPATWDAATRTIKVTGAPTMPTCVATGVGTKQAKTTCTK